VRRNQIEGRSGIRQGLKRFDAMDDASQPEHGNCFPKNRFSINVQTEHIMTEAFGDVEKVSGAATDIQDPQARRRLFEPQVSHALHVRVHPILKVEIFLWRDAIVRIEVPLFDDVESLAINRVDEWFGIQRIG
jgi:hypothetical protein